ncbi:MAG: hypothetical protein ACTSSH_11410 [Candidatus Heimdallarchaeota archaeon]
MRFETSILSTNEVTGQTVLNWLLPALGVLAAIFIIWFAWRYLREGNPAGRLSEFNERTFKKLIEHEGDQVQKPLCSKCKLPMRYETKYEDFRQDQGEFNIQRKAAKETLVILAKSKRITKRDKTRILEFFDDHPEISEQLFKRYKCTNCEKVEILPFKSPKIND